MYPELALLGLSLAYHRWFVDKPPKPKPIREMQVPRTDEGAPIPLLFGRIRVRQPVLAWISTPDTKTLDDLALSHGSHVGGFDYGANMFYVVGRVMEGQVATLHSIWASDMKMRCEPHGAPSVPRVASLAELIGNGNDEYLTRRAVVREKVGAPRLQGEVELLDGRTTQRLVDPAGPTAETLAATKMIADGVDADRIPGYRGLMCVGLYEYPPDDTSFPSEIVDGFCLGSSPSIPPFSFEAWAITQSPIGTVSVVDAGDGAIELNPIDALYDILIGSYGKLGLEPARIDRNGTFKTAANTLLEEGNGYSRAIEDSTTAQDVIDEILRQIDAALYEDPTDGKIKIKLIRPDYDPATVPHLTVSNTLLESFEVVGNTTPVTSVRTIFNDRSKGYTDNSGIAPNMAAASTLNNQINEVEIPTPGVCTQELADTIAGRELMFLSRPLIKATVLVSRAFLRVVNGDVVKWTWPEFGLSERFFRVAIVDRGTREDGRIRLSLLEEIYTVHRGVLDGIGLFPAQSSLSFEAIPEES